MGIHLPSLSTVSRNWGTLLDSGVPAVKATKMAGQKARDAKLRRAMGGVADDLAGGSQMGDALAEAHVFPTLYVDLVATAENTGAVPEVLHALAEHYERVVKLKREFRAQILPSVLQFTAATLIVALLIYILGILPGGAAFDVTGLGLRGGTGAMVFLGVMAAAVAAAVVLYKMLSSIVPAARAMHELLLAVPIIGPCMRNFALARFSWAFHLTQNAGLPIKPSMQAALRATGNGAYTSVTDGLLDRLMAGEPVSEALAAEPLLFPDDYVEIVRVGETSGTVPEMLHRISPDLEDNARRSLKALATAAGWLIWMLVAGMIIYIILRVALSYISMINEAAAGI